MYKKFIIPIIIVISIFVAIIILSRDNSNDIQDDYSKHIKILNKIILLILWFMEKQEDWMKYKRCFKILDKKTKINSFRFWIKPS